MKFIKIKKEGVCEFYNLESITSFSCKNGVVAFKQQATDSKPVIVNVANVDIVDENDIKNLVAEKNREATTE